MGISLPCCDGRPDQADAPCIFQKLCQIVIERSEEHTSELQSLMRISYAVFCLKKKTQDKELYPEKLLQKETYETPQNRPPLHQSHKQTTAHPPALQAHT